MLFRAHWAALRQRRLEFSLPVCVFIVEFALTNLLCTFEESVFQPLDVSFIQTAIGRDEYNSLRPKVLFREMAVDAIANAITLPDVQSRQILFAFAVAMKDVDTGIPKIRYMFGIGR